MAKEDIADKLDDARRDLHDAQAKLNYLLEVFGDSLPAKHGWKNRLDGLEAVQYYLIQKHHWLPSEVKSMSLEDMRFALSEELAGWRAPQGTRP